MATGNLSPGVNINEIDATNTIPSVSTTTGAFAGGFVWGPANVITQVTNELQLAQTFGSPDSNTYNNFFTCSSFLAYGNDLRVVRAANSSSLNATVTNPTQIANENVYASEYYLSNNQNEFGPFAARYPGALGNSIQVQVWDSSNTALFNSWQYKGYFGTTTTTSSYVQSNGGSNDELHIIVIDSLGLITGTQGTVLEQYPFLSKASDALDNNNQSTYYKNVIFNKSQYIYVMDPADYANTNSTWGLSSSNTNFARIQSTNTGFATYNMTGGTYVAPATGDIENAYSLFANKDVVDISLVLTGAHNITIQQYVIDNIVTAAGSSTGRSGDSIAFISPPSSAVVNVPGQESTNIQNWLTSLARSSSYVVVDSRWKYMYDKYNNVYRYVPLNGDIAGLCVYTDSIADPWYSPAGFNRGNIKNAIKLAWNPSKTDRDTLYPLGVNPVVAFPGNGIILYGDKTLQTKPSAFDRINVRRLFIVLEKAIALAAKYSLFEFNDDFTRSQFVSLVTPYLRTVQGRRGITAFQVVCDTTNNTPAVIDANQFIGSIFIQPARSINFITLNFVAVGTGVDFTEIAGAI